MVNKFSTYILNRRKELGYSQAALAEKVGCRATTIGTWESSQNRPRGDRIYKLAAALEIPLEELESITEVKLKPHARTYGFQLKSKLNITKKAYLQKIGEENSPLQINARQIVEDAFSKIEEALQECAIIDKLCS